METQSVRTLQFNDIFPLIQATAAAPTSLFDEEDLSSSAMASASPATATATPLSGGRPRSLRSTSPTVVGDEDDEDNFKAYYDDEFELPASPRVEPKLFLRRSRLYALSEAAKEAEVVVADQGLDADDPVSCKRGGCNSVLSGMQALARHLDVHNLASQHDYQKGTCSCCKATLKRKAEEMLHECSPPQTTSKRRILKRGIRKLLVKRKH
ncbi:hypothetical protein D9613_007445 [Agrocybe pediades]|uniref:C2H2-type domain-containing protein n=1 Tax=Agrocybe pediades TaxID=84607 RepID=A0A8H4QNG4_9AGAR|nr:hypothetical protein D9613_007445 [Agrocybe pediades]